VTSILSVVSAEPARPQAGRGFASLCAAPATLRAGVAALGRSGARLEATREHAGPLPGTTPEPTRVSGRVANEILLWKR
jgi:hypothetical protein